MKEDEVVAVGYKKDDPKFEPELDQGRIMKCKHCGCDVQFSKITSDRMKKIKRKITASCMECLKLHAVPDPKVMRPTKKEIELFRKKYPNQTIDEVAIRNMMNKFKQDAETGVEENDI